MVATTMSDDDDRRVFASLLPALVATILRIKNNYPSATELDLTIGGLNESALARLGQILGQATHLKELRLVGVSPAMLALGRVNDIDVTSLLGGLGLNRSIRCLDVSHADLGGTRLSPLESFLKHNHCLESLVLRDCHLDSSAIDLLSQALLGRSEDTLNYLNLDTNPLLGDAHLDKLVQVVKRNKMHRLSLANTSIGGRGCDSLTGLLSDTNSRLTHLYIDNNSIDDEALKTLVESLAKNTKLRVLGVNGNSEISATEWANATLAIMAASTMSDDEDKGLFAPLVDPALVYTIPYRLIETILRIKHNDPRATILDLRSMRGLDEGAVLRLGEILGQAKYLETFGYNNQNGASLWVSLLGGLGLNGSIKRFCISDVDLGDTRLSPLEPFLKHNNCLTHLGLDKCNLDSAALDLLSRALLARSENTLRTLRLADNPLSDANLDKLVQVAKRNNKMTELSLSNTGIGKTGCDSLAELLSDPRSELKVLRLANNSIDDEAVSVLVESLANNTKLGTLDLRENSRISKAGWLSVLDLICNSSNIDGVRNSNEVINRVLASNHTLDLGFFYSSDRNAIARAIGTEKANLLFASLEVNMPGDIDSAARHKIIWSHARGDLNVGESSVVEDVRVLPDILAWFSVDQSWAVQYRDDPFEDAAVGAVRLGALFRIVKSRPDLRSRDQP